MLRLGSWVFSPSWLPTVLTLLLLPLLLTLGAWQLHRATFKQNLLDQFAARSQQVPQPLVGNEPLYTAVKVTGYYDNQHPILMDNRIVNHQVGYDVLSPFIPQTGHKVLLVNRGWIPRNSYAQPLPVIAPIAGEQTISGLVQIPQHNLVLAQSKAAVSWPLLLEDIRLQNLQTTLGRPLYPFILLLSQDNGGGFIRHWQIDTLISPDRHRAYAFQWFALALTLAILFIKLNISRNNNE